MKKYKDKKNTRLEEICCNKCGRQLKIEKGILKEGCFTGEVVFGFFSRKDGIRHRFDLCEDCYDAMIKDFVIPVYEAEEKELC